MVSGDGEIATNAHVVTTGEVPDLQEASEVYVEFADGNQVEAEVKGYDPDADIALLKVDPEGLTLRPLMLGTGEEVEVGTPVAAIGSPFGERQSLSVGVVSAVDRSITSLTAYRIAGAIQTDAAINPGNSGGPLVNGAGEVIGVNQQIETSAGSRTSSGVGFAVPVDVVRRSLAQLRKRGRGALRVPRRGDRDDLPAAARALRPARRARRVGAGRHAGRPGGGGAACAAATTRRASRSGSFRPAATSSRASPAGRSRSRTTSPRVVARLDPGRTVTVEAWRDGERRRLRLRLGERPLSAAARRGLSGDFRPQYSPRPVLQSVAVAHKSLADYTHIVGRSLVEEVRELAEPLRGRRVVHLSATAFGGGVSEILYTLVPLMRDIGLEVEWQVIYGREEFFNATKLMHNALQGSPQDLTEEQWATWFQYNEMNARELGRDWDVCVVHDPQPAAIRSLAPEKAAAWVWRCHIDVSTPNPATLARLLPYLNGYPASLFHVAGYVPAGMDGGVNVVPPAIDPLAPKNMALSHQDAVYVCEQFGIDAVPPADLPGVALRPVEGPARRDRRLPHRQGPAARRATGARGVHGERRSRGMGLLQLDARARRGRPGHPHPQQLQQRRRDRGQRLPVARGRRDPEVHARGLRPHGERGAVEGAARSSAATWAASRSRCRTA